jgi:phosphoesterase RecJ-like protein
MTPQIASNLFIGSYTDTGGFKYEGVTPETFKVAGELAKYIDDIPSLIFKMENWTTLGFLKFQAVAFESISIHLDGIMAISSIPYSVIESKGLIEEDIQVSRISSFLRTVPEWKIVACVVEVPEGKIKISFRSSDSKIYDVSKLAAELGGGGHKAAAGARLQMSIDEAIKKVVEIAKIIYNL